MNDQEPVVFYPTKMRLIPIALNIALAPTLLYLTRLWPWPPASWHFMIFILSSYIAIRFIKNVTAKPRLILDDKGLHYAGTIYPNESIVAVKPYMRALVIWIDRDGREKEKVINLWWAGKEDIQKIYEQALTRFTARE